MVTYVPALIKLFTESKIAQLVPDACEISINEEAPVRGFF